MAQCEAQTKRKDEEALRQCRRYAVAGSQFCQAHGGMQDTKTPEAPRLRNDRGNQVQCSANSKRTGKRCQRMAILGGTVCKHHGGAVPQVKAKARERMEALIAPAIQELQTILTKPDTSDADRLRAITLLLDRTGFGPKSEVGVEVKKYEQIAVSIIREIPEQLEEAQIVEDDSDEETIEVENYTSQNVIEERSGEDQEATERYPEPIPLVPRIVGSAQPPTHLR